MKDFNQFRFAGLNLREASNKYYTMDRISADKNKIVVKVASQHLVTTKFGYALILNRYQVVFLKPWQVNCNWFGNEVLLDRAFFNVKNWGEHMEFSEVLDSNTFDEWLAVAEQQEDLVDECGFKANPVRWLK